MSNQKSSVKAKNKDPEPTFWEWLVHGKGTVSEPWPTVEEVLADPEVQKQIQDVQEAFTEYQQAKNNPNKKDS